jgi:hypothetical protein
MLRENDLLKTIDGETLLNSPLNSPEFIVSHLIPQGIHLLGGSPKIGKSWLVLWMCLQIANGEPIWNYETRRGTVLYLALEDSFERLQSNVDRFIALANKYIYIEELTPEILRTFVSKITIHENDKDNPGAKYEIDIFLTHIGKFW